MDLYEYQAKELLEKNGVPVARRCLALSAGDIKSAIQSVGGFPVVLKAQIHSGDRAGAGGVRIVHSYREAEAAARQIFGRTLVTRQTGAEGQVVRKVLVHAYLDVRDELYCALLLDRERRQSAFIYSKEGGTDIEKTVRRRPGAVRRQPIHPCYGLWGFSARQMAGQLGLDKSLLKPAVEFFTAMYRTYVRHDCTLIEINPLVVTPENRLFALDAKIQVDDNALFRRPVPAGLQETPDQGPPAQAAFLHGLQYVKLDGSVGCMVNGAGLAMATMDLIKTFGYAPANFLDIGGTASVETVKNGFDILSRDPDVRLIFINIFGGIVRCDRVAKGIIQALSGSTIDVPLVIRMAGTHADVAARLLKQSGRDFTIINDLRAVGKILQSCLKKPE